MMIYAQKDGLIAGDRLPVVLADDVNDAPLLPPRVKHG